VLATAATARQTEFGEPAAADPPAWALAVPALGPASLDPRQRVEWVRRAGIVAAYADALGSYPNEADRIAGLAIVFSEFGQPI